MAYIYYNHAEPAAITGPANAEKINEGLIDAFAPGVNNAQVTFTYPEPVSVQGVIVVNHNLSYINLYTSLDNFNTHERHTITSSTGIIVFSKVITASSFRFGFNSTDALTVGRVFLPLSRVEFDTYYPMGIVGVADRTELHGLTRRIKYSKHRWDITLKVKYAQNEKLYSICEALQSAGGQVLDLEGVGAVYGAGAGDISSSKDVTGNEFSFTFNQAYFPGCRACIK